MNDNNDNTVKFRARSSSRRLAMVLLAGCLTGTACTPSPPEATPHDTSSDAAYLPTIENPATPPGPAPEGMVWIPGGELSMGLDPRAEALSSLPGVTRDAQPIHRVYVDGFWMDATEVTNAQFQSFVEATGYVTVAERVPRAEDYPDVPVEDLVAGSAVFTPTSEPVSFSSSYAWWRYQPGADWRHPEGPDSDLTGRDQYPVVQIAYEDAEAYARWAGKRLPTEAELEFAARGGKAGQLYPWGDDLHPDGKDMANTYQGRFPMADKGRDGFAGAAPVASFPPNDYGLFDIAGNVWEWCSDWYRPDYYAELAARGSVAVNPRGPDESFDPAEPGVPKRVHRGGSFLCSDEYCIRYLVGARGKGDVTMGTNHLGFRCVRSPAGAR